MINTLKSLCALNGVSGNEGEVRDYIIGRAEKYTDSITVDAMGNLIASKKGAVTPARKVALCAHMDEVGVIITGFTDDGFLKFATVGGIDSRVIIGKAVNIGGSRLFGMIGCKAMHLVKDKEKDKAAEVDDLFIDIGAKSREDAESRVCLGDTGAFDAEIREFGDGFIKAKAIDDRFGCSVLLHLLESDLPIDCTFVFTVQEEVGLRGAYTASYGAAPDIALIVEGTIAADLPSVSGNKRVCKVGCGAVIPFMDGSTIYDRELYNILTGIAGDNDIMWQTKTMVSSGTDAAAFQRSRAGVKTAGIAAPVRNLHSASCVAKVSDLEAVFDLARLFLAKVGALA
ncbi:MAG: M42 family peptidase [Oscillospiraceae bacterium]|nr:M42 family peptidase [Oscillospiraceae bacterium]